MSVEEFDLEIEVFDTPTRVKVTNYCEQVFWETGLLPTIERIAEELQEHKFVVREVLKDEEFKKSLQSRGIDLNTQKSNKLLTPQQLLCVNVMLNLYDKRSERSKLEEIGVTPQQYSVWKRTPQFSEYVAKRVESMFTSADAEAFSSLIKNVKAGDNTAIKLFMEMRGHFTPRLNVDINVNAVLVNVVEIITKHITDPVVLNNIANDLENVIELTKPKKAIGA